MQGAHIAAEALTFWQITPNYFSRHQVTELHNLVKANYERGGLYKRFSLGKSYRLHTDPGNFIDYFSVNCALHFRIYADVLRSRHRYYLGALLQVFAE